VGGILLRRVGSIDMVVSKAVLEHVENARTT
jgi:hypothetical protein